MKKPLFLFHGSCYDGFTAAWIFHKMHPDGANAEYVACSYGTDPPDCKGREVWLVDFSYKRDILVDKVIVPSMRTIIMDHHKTAEEDLQGLLQEVRSKHYVQRNGDRVVFDMSRSGSAILYDELDQIAGQKAGFHKPRINGRRENWLVDYVEDRDLWKWQLGNSKEISAYLASVPMTFEEWDAAYAQTPQILAEKGKAILRYQDTFNAKAIEHSRLAEIQGYNVPVINTPYMGCSERINLLLDKYPDARFAANYFQRGDGIWQFGLRSRQSEDCDVSAIAKVFGGGGHKNAAGFEVAILPWPHQAKTVGDNPLAVFDAQTGKVVSE